MELTATKEQLLPPLMRAAAASGGGTLPVLEHLLLQPGDALAVTGTDLETEIVASGDFPVGGQAVALPGRKLINIVRLWSMNMPSHSRATATGRVGNSGGHHTESRLACPIAES